MLPSPFTRQSNAIASYDWIDITSGCGYREYYCAGSKNSTSNYYFLTTKVIDSSTELLWNTGVNQDLDFDITIKVPSVIGNADAIINFTWSQNASQTSTVTINIYHVTAAGAETLLGTLALARTAGGGGAEYYRECFKITLISKKFAINEKLRVNMTLTSTNADTRVYFDPSTARTFTDLSTRTVGSDMVVLVPFKIDITQ